MAMDLVTMASESEEMVVLVAVLAVERRWKRMVHGPCPWEALENPRALGRA